MKILMLIPKYDLTDKPSYAYLPPLGIGYILSTIKKAGYDVKTINLNHHSIVSDAIKNELKNNKYDIVCTGHTGLGYPMIKKIIEVARTQPNIKIILGGALFTSEPTLMFNSLKPDFVVLGEGEETIVDLLKSIEKNKSYNKVKGIMYNENGKIVITEPREPIKDIDFLPFPNFESMEYEKYLENVPSSQIEYTFDYPRVYPILASRSCPFNCTFCYHSIKKYRERSLTNIIEEIKYAVKKYKINYLMVLDDLFSLNKERLYKFCLEMQKIRESISWELLWFCQLMVSSVDSEMLDMLKNSGCCTISYGFESYSPKVLKSMKKSITPEQIDAALKLTLEKKIYIRANFIFGDVAETKETSKETLDYWKNNCQAQVSLDFIQPYPGSAIYNLCVEKGIIKDKLKFIQNEMGTVILNMTEKMTDSEINELYAETLKLRRKYDKFIVPKLKHEKDDRYEIKLKCPYCKEMLIYKNCDFKDTLIYKKYIVCRKCRMRFTIWSPIVKIFSVFPLVSSVLNRYRERAKRIIRSIK